MTQPHQAQAQALAHAARTALRAGDASGALRMAVELLASGPRLSEHLLLHANAALAAEETAAAIDSLRLLRKRHPAEASIRNGLAAACNRHGSRLLQQGNPEFAIAAFRETLVLQPAHPLAGFNLALALNRQGQRSDALQAVQQHLMHHPDDIEAGLQQAWWQLPLETARSRIVSLLNHPAADRLPPQLAALAAAETGRADLALTLLQRVPTQQQPSLAADVADRLREQGERGSAIAAYRHGATAAPGACLRMEIGAALSISRLPESTTAIDEERQAFSDGLDSLDSRWNSGHLGRPGRSLEELCWSNFFLAYHGRDDRRLQRGFAQLLERAAGAIEPALAEPPAAAVAGRVGLLSSCWRDCTVGAYFGSWVRWLNDAGYEVHLYQLGPTADVASPDIS